MSAELFYGKPLLCKRNTIKVDLYVENELRMPREFPKTELS